MTRQPEKDTAIYTRLSRDDELQGDSNSIIHQKDKRHILIHDLKRPVEELAGVEAAGIDPLHLHQAADGKSISYPQGGAARKDIDQPDPPAPLPDGIVFPRNR